MANLKDFVLVSGGIASAALSGGTVPAILAGIAGVSKLLGNDEPDDHEKKLREWVVPKIQDWMQVSLGMMQRPMRDDLKAALLRDKIATDWFQFQGERAKDSWVNKMAEDVVSAVKTNIALGLLDMPTEES